MAKSYDNNFVIQSIFPNVKNELISKSRIWTEL
jgi:hypothetical protein